MTGVQIWRYPAPYFLYAKHLSIDNDGAVIGSSNMDIRSFIRELRISLLVRGRVFVDEIRAVEGGYPEINSLLRTTRPMTLFPIMGKEDAERKGVRKVGTASGEILPLVLGIAISPIPIIAAILMLFSPRGRSTSLGCMIDWFSGVVLAVVVFTLLSAILPCRVPARRSRLLVSSS